MHGERLANFPLIGDIIQAYFLSVMFYLMFLQNWKLEKQGSNFHWWSEYKACRANEALCAHSDLLLAPPPGRVPRHLAVGLWCQLRLRLLSSAKAGGAKALMRLEQAGPLTKTHDGGTCSLFFYPIKQQE